MEYGLKPTPTITQLKLQKLVYFAHGWYMAFCEDPLVDNEYVEAWKFGPVFPSLYQEFKYYGRDPIRERSGTFVRASPRGVRFVAEEEPNDSDVIAILDKVWDVYGWRTAGQLSTMCHEEGTPWDITRRRTQGRVNANIEDELIREHFKKKRAA